MFAYMSEFGTQREEQIKQQTSEECVFWKRYRMMIQKRNKIITETSNDRWQIKTNG
jgi:hypothetical protein